MLARATVAGSRPLPFDPDMVTPGVIGFAVTVLVAVAVMLLMWDFNRRVRRINDRADIKERIAAEVAERDAAERDAAERAAAEGQPDAVAEEVVEAEARLEADEAAERERRAGA